MFHKIGHIFLALMVFISSSGVVVNKHYCCGILRSVALFVEPEECVGEDTDANISCFSLMGGSAVQQKDCCDDEAAFIQLKDKKASPQLGLPEFKVVLDWTPMPIAFWQVPQASFFNPTFLFQYYKPPIPAIRSHPQAYLQVFRC